MLKRSCVFSGILILFLSISTFAAAPRLINFQGKLTSSQGTPETGSKTLVFSLYDDATAGTQVWGPETVTGVLLDSAGQFSTVLGNTVPLNIDFSKSLWLKVTYNSQDFLPRQSLSAVPYAFYAITAESVVGGGSGGVSSIASAGGTRLTGNVDIKGGMNVTVAQTGNTIEVSATGGGGGGSYVSKAGDTMTGALTIEGEKLTINGNNLLSTVYNDNQGTGYPSPGLNGQRARGTSASPQPVVNGDRLLALNGKGWFPNSPIEGWSGARGSILINAAQNWTDSAQGTYILFRTTSKETTSLQDTMCIADNGNVGIGTTNPGQKLDVRGMIRTASNGDAVVRADAYLPGRDTTYSPAFSGRSAQGTLGGSVTNTCSNDILASFNGRGYVSETGGFVSGSRGAMDVIATEDWNSGAQGAKINFRTTNKGATSASVKATILDNGNVGIGTGNPTAQLDVAGQVRIRSGGPDTGKVLTAIDNSGLAIWQTAGGGGSSTWTQSGSSLYPVNLGTNVGIGTTDAQSSLHVYGDNPRIVLDYGGSPFSTGLEFKNHSGAYTAAVKWNQNNGRMEFCAGSTGGPDAIKLSLQGNGAVAMGNNTTAEGNASTAMGQGTIAHGQYSTAMGQNTTANAQNSVAMGYGTTASGPYSIAMGYGINSMGGHSFGIGLDETERTITRSNTMVIMGGNVGIGTTEATGAQLVVKNSGDGLPGLQIITTGSKPAASATYRGAIFVEQGSTPDPDKVYMCLKMNADAYQWVQIAIGQ